MRSLRDEEPLPVDNGVSMEMFDCSDDLENDGLDFWKGEGASLGIDEIIQ